MCYGGCKQTCESCRPKFVICPVCGNRALLAMNACYKCGAVLSEEVKEKARRKWAEERGL